MNRLYFFYILLLLPFLAICLSLVLLILTSWQDVRITDQPVSTALPSNTISEVVIDPYVPTNPSLISIFNSDHLWIATLSAEKVTTIVATGDVIPARLVNYIAAKSNNYKWAYENIAPLLRSGNITLINLEAPLVSGCPLTREGMVFCADVQSSEGLIFSGIDVANLANNHMGNYGQEGVDETIELLNKAGIAVSGTYAPTYIDHNSVRFAFLGYNDIGRQVGVAHVSDKTFVSDIQQAVKLADVVIVSFHWGEEYTSQPTTRQREIAHRAVDAGASLVIGNHPHWIQPAELYKDGIIVYAHGNAIFDQMWSQKTREGVLGRYTFYEDTLIDAEFFPIVIEDYGQPRYADSQEKQRILEDMKRESLLMRGKL